MNTDSLNEQTQATLADFLGGLPADQQSTVAQAFQDLMASDTAAQAKQSGDRAPDFALPNVRGGTLRLHDLCAEGPVVLSFYRGSWCPFCNLELNALQRRLPDIRSRGARLVAVSPELPDASLSHAQKLHLEFDVLSDVGNGVAGEYGLIMTVPAELRPLYREWGIDLSAANGDTTHQLPVPATYVIDRSGTIRAACVDKDYTRRMEPDAIIEALGSV
jgi:peroxiredoxin